MTEPESTVIYIPDTGVDPVIGTRFDVRAGTLDANLLTGSHVLTSWRRVERPDGSILELILDATLPSA